MADISKIRGFLLAAVAMVFTFTASAFAQSMDTAYVPFNVNVNAKATAQLAGGGKFEKSVRSGYTDTLLIVTKGESTPLARQGKTPNPVTMYGSRGKISLELSRQLYRSTDIALYSLNGKQIMHGKASVSEAIKSISHPNVAMGVYLLSVKGVNGGTFTTRFAHSGGGLNIDVAFANGNSGLLMEKPISGNWTITVSAEGYLDTSYAFVPEIGRGKTGVQEINLWQTVLLSSSSEIVPPSSSAVVVPSSSSEIIPSSSSEIEPSSSSKSEQSSSSSESEPGRSSSSETEPEQSSSSEEIEPESSSSSSEETEPEPSSSSLEEIEPEPSSSSSEETEPESSSSSEEAEPEPSSSSSETEPEQSSSSEEAEPEQSSSSSSESDNEQSSSSQVYLPNPPSFVIATANSVNSITVNWLSVSNASDYCVYRSTAVDGVYTLIAFSTATSYTDNSLSSGTTYYYKVAAYNSYGEGAQSIYTASATTLLDVPTSVTATATSVDNITVVWGSVTGATGYYIYRSTIADGVYSQIGTSATASYEDNPLQSSTTYYYKVAAYNSGGTGSQSSYASATTPPDVPIGVTATVNSVSSITISWESVTGATGYNVYRSTTADGTYIFVSASATISYTNTGLSSGTIYYYKVQAYNSVVTGTQSGYISVATLPNMPTGVTATANSTSSITVSWGSVTGADRYYIYRSAAASGAYSEIGTSETASYADNSLSSSTTYYYKIAAYNSGGIGSQSNYASTATLPDVPTGVTATANSTSSITVSWGSVTGATGYIIYRCESSSGTYTQVGSTSATTSYTNTDLSPGRYYFYKIAAYNSGGAGTQSSYAYTATPLGVPTGVTAAVVYDIEYKYSPVLPSVIVSWEPVTGAIEYYIYSSTTANGTYSHVGSTSETTSYTERNPTHGVTHYYKIVAFAHSGESTQSSYASATIPFEAPTYVRTYVSAGANSTSSIYVTWNHPGGMDKVDGFYIYRSTTPGGTYSQIGSVAKMDGATSLYIDNNISSGTTYYYKVAAYNSIVTGILSSFASTSTLDVVSGIKATANSESSITVSWDYPVATGFYIYRSTAYNGTYSQISSVVGNYETSYTNTGLSPGTIYYYKVAAYNSEGTGTQSEYAATETLPGVPTGVTATANSANSITVSWEPVTGANGYYVYCSESYNGTCGGFGSYDYLNGTSYTNTGLSPVTTYYYQVAAYNSEGIGAQSGYVSATTPFGPPVGVTAIANSESSIAVSWDYVTGATGYYIYRSTNNGTYTQVGTSTTASYADTDLSSNTTYYYRIASYNSGGTSGGQSNYASAVTFLPAVSTCLADSTITIGSQTWMKGNLNCDVSGSKCYNNNSANCDGYGRLYDWATAMNLSSSCNSNKCPVQHPHKGICPSGWHLPSHEEWQTLIDFVGGAVIAGDKLKATSGWNGYVHGDNYGFSALPGGHGNYSAFNNVGYEGHWWSASANDNNRFIAYHLLITYSNTSSDLSNTSSNLSRSTDEKFNSYSVRCLRDYEVTLLPDAPANITAIANSESSITVSWKPVTSAIGYYIYRSTSASGIYSEIGTSATTSYADNSLLSGTTYYYKVIAYNSEGASTQSGYVSAATFLPTVSTCVANSTITIGSQTWMKGNLNCDVSGSKCYNNNSANCYTYGRLYDWATAMNLPSSCNSNNCQVQHPHKGICPSGWHLPSHEEWQTLIDFVGGAYELKARSWNGNDGDEYGFSALPGGDGYSSGSFINVEREGHWWSSTERGSNHAYRRYMYYYNRDVYRDYDVKSDLFSVRCVKD